MIALRLTRGFSAGHRQIFLTNNNRVNGQGNREPGSCSAPFHLLPKMESEGLSQSLQKP